MVILAVQVAERSAAQQPGLFINDVDAAAVPDQKQLAVFMGMFMADIFFRVPEMKHHAFQRMVKVGFPGQHERHRHSSCVITVKR